MGRRLLRKSLNHWLDGRYRPLLQRPLFKQQGKKSSGPAKVDAQFMAVALATYFTRSDLAGSAAADYGCNVTQTGIGTKVVNVSTNGDAFNITDNTHLTIMQL